MTFWQFIDKHLKTILIFIGVLLATGGFGVREAYLSSAQFYGMWNALMAAPADTIMRLLQ